MAITITKNISNTIDLSDVMTVDLMNNWNVVTSVLIDKHLEREIEITPTIAAKYTFDMYGLFLNELGIQPELIYPHIRVNGYSSSSEYEGINKYIKLIDTGIALSYYKLFNKN